MQSAAAAGSCLSCSTHESNAICLEVYRAALAFVSTALWMRTRYTRLASLKRQLLSPNDQLGSRLTRRVTLKLEEPHSRGWSAAAFCAAAWPLTTSPDSFSSRNHSCLSSTYKI